MIITQNSNVCSASNHPRKRPVYYHHNHQATLLLLLLWLAIAWLNTATAEVVVYNQPCQDVLPFHAIAMPLADNLTSCAWRCSEGYYSTTPSSQSGVSTCRPCSKPHVCGVGRAQSQCTPYSDATCTLCPSLPSIPGREGEVYNTPNDCLNTVCGDGWWLNPNTTTTSPQKCLPCPPGDFCIGGTLYTCGQNCSTGTSGGASSMLECKQTVGQELAFSIKFTLSATSFASENNQCPPLNAGIVAWLQHGTFQGCVLDFLTPTLGTATCTISAAHCVAGEYLRWLLQQLSMRQAQTTRWLAACLQAPNLFVGTPLVQQNPLFLYTSSSSIDKAKRAIPPANPPPLIIEPPRWGVSHAEALAVFGLFLLVCSGLTIALLLLCAMWRTNATKLSIVSKLYKAIQTRHAASRVKQGVQVLKNDVALATTTELKKDIP
jgi:hypothetical protein